MNFKCLLCFWEDTDADFGKCVLFFFFFSGGIILSGGLIGFVFSKNAVSLGTGVLYGGALLALSTYSMKIWRQGKSSIPFVLGQAGN